VYNGQGFSVFRHDQEKMNVFQCKGWLFMNKIPTDYTSSVHTTQVGKRKMVVRSLTPKLSDEEYKDVKKSIEKSLFDIFYKYMT